MATIKNSHSNYLLQNVSGRIGSLVIRQHKNGKTVISGRPAEFKVSQKPQCVAIRKKFKTMSTFASFINSIPTLSEIWKAAQIKGTYARSKIIKHNYNYADPERPTIRNIITPDIYHIRLRKVNINGDNIQFDIEDNFRFQPNDMCFLILLLFDPIEPEREMFKLFNISPDIISNFTINLDIPYHNLKFFRQFVLYCAVARKVGDQLQWSNTYPIEGEVETLKGS